MSRALLLAMALLLVTLAGCSDDKPDPVDPGPVPDRVAQGKGVIRGVVIDASITPVADATVAVESAELSARTDADGAFLFVDVEPGTYFLTVSKPGWSSAQQSLEVVADVKAPPVVKVQLQQVPGSQPVATTQAMEGFIACSYGVPVTYGSCAIGEVGQEEQTVLQFPFEGIPAAIQVEVVWESTQPSGDNLYLIEAVCADEDCPVAGENNIDGFPSRFEEGTRQSPAVARADSAFIQGRDLPGRGVLAVDVSADGPALATGVALDQAFTVYATFFYNMQPMDGWTFLEDGKHPVPS